ncbi:MAG: hypothetical protein QOI64_2399, partial [Solirubrobacteraceae bacterium]|nr:hypothetical protein [Solirubrobacteraceae bacterium]
ELGAALSRARSGHGRVVLMEGPAGIGKTRLLDEARERAHGLGLEVLAARGGPLERTYGFGIARQLLESAVASASADERAELLSGAAMLATPVFSASAATPPEGTDATHSVLHGLYWLVANLAERSPLLLAVDDVHWADGPSLRFLLYLARRLEGLPVALVLALRSGEASTDPELLRALRLEAHPPVIEPGPLSLQATSTLTAARLGRVVAEELVHACHTATRGNPFLLTELLYELRGASTDVDPATVGSMASERVAAAIVLRVGRLGPAAAALVQATSVLGESADLQTAAELAGVDGPTAATLADALVQAEILEPGPATQRLRFVHPLVRGAIYEDMPRSERALLHGRAAQLLTRSRRDAGAVAMHLMRSDPAGRAATVDLLRDAARAAMARGAPEIAFEFLERAQRERPSQASSPALLLELGVAASRAGRGDGVELLREAFRVAPGQPARARAGLELAFALGVSSSRSGAVIDVLERAREDLQDEGLRALLDARMTMFSVLVPSARARLAERLAEARTALDRPMSDETRVLLGPLTADLLLQGAPAADVCRLAERALAGGDLMRRDVAMEADFALGALGSLIHAGGLGAAKQHIDEGVAHARARGSRYGLGRLCAYRALLYWRLGELATAESDAHTALSVEAAWGIPHATATAIVVQVQIERSDLGAARRHLDNLDADEAMLEVTANQLVRAARATLLVAEGQPGEALTQLDACARWEQQSGSERRLGPVMWRSAAALVQLQLGETDEARALAACEVQLTREFGAAPQLGAALRALAIVEGGAAGLELLEEAVAVLEASGARLEHARAVVERGALLRRLGQRTAATEALRAGMDMADRCGATALAEAAAAQLRLAGTRPRRMATHGRDSLTPGEHRVSDLAAQGLSNKQIAQALFVTLRTVEMHLSNAYRKLEISSREQLPAVLSAP